MPVLFHPCANKYDFLRFSFFFQVVLVLVIDASAVIVSDPLGRMPYFAQKWPLLQPNSRSQSLRQQMLHQLRSSGRLPTNMLFRHKMPQQIAVAQSFMRPIKLAPVTLKKGQPLIAAPSYYRPTVATPQKYRFRSSAPAPHSGEYVFENPFANHNNVAIQPVCGLFCESRV